MHTRARDILVGKGRHTGGQGAAPARNRPPRVNKTCGGGSFADAQGGVAADLVVCVERVPDVEDGGVVPAACRVLVHLGDDLLHAVLLVPRLHRALRQHGVSTQKSAHRSQHTVSTRSSHVLIAHCALCCIVWGGARGVAGSALMAACTRGRGGRAGEDAASAGKALRGAARHGVRTLLALWFAYLWREQTSCTRAHRRLRGWHARTMVT